MTLPKIEEEQRGNLATSRNAEHNDVFISYKELDKDEAQAQQLYRQALDKQEAERQAALAIKETDYQSACELESKAETEGGFHLAVEAFCAMGEYKDSPQRRQQCIARAEVLRTKAAALRARKVKNLSDLLP